MEKKILITGATGFIGRALCDRLSRNYQILALYHQQPPNENNGVEWQLTNLNDFHSINQVCQSFQPDLIVHCAALAHQKITRFDSNEYLRINSYSTENLASAAANAKPNVHFIFLSSISVYGERVTEKTINENISCSPSSDYALSKLDAEKRLGQLYKKGVLRKLNILRLAPVYDAEWSLNLERRVFAPKKLAYLKFGAGEQKMSALSRSNLADFICFIICYESEIDTRYAKDSFSNIYNTCDERTYSFNEIIQIFRKSKHQPSRLLIRIPLFLVWIVTRIAGIFLKSKKKWFHSCYDKLACSLIFDNSRMLNTGFKPRHSLKSVFTG